MMELCYEWGNELYEFENQLKNEENEEHNCLNYAFPQLCQLLEYIVLNETNEEDEKKKISIDLLDETEERYKITRRCNSQVALEDLRNFSKLPYKITQINIVKPTSLIESKTWWSIQVNSDSMAIIKRNPSKNEPTIDLFFFKANIENELKSIITKYRRPNNQSSNKRRKIEPKFGLC